MRLYKDGILIEEMDSEYIYKYSTVSGVGTVDVFDLNNNLIKQYKLERKLDSQGNIIYEKIIYPDNSGRLFIAKIDY